MLFYVFLLIYLCMFQRKKRNSNPAELWMQTANFRQNEIYCEDDQGTAGESTQCLNSQTA